MYTVYGIQSYVWEFSISFPNQSDAKMAGVLWFVMSFFDEIWLKFTFCDLSWNFNSYQG